MNDLFMKVSDYDIIPRMSSHLTTLVSNVGKDTNTINIVCIGTDRSTGDCLGPLVGTMLCECEGILPPWVNLYGTLENPLHAKNIADIIPQINQEYSTLAIDASLGATESVGSLHMFRGSLHPGAGLGKSLPPIGDIATTGIVGVSGYMEYFVLQNTRFNMVYKMAKAMVEIIHKGLFAGV